MKMLLSLVAMGCAMAAVAVLVVVDLVLRFWPVLVAAAVVIVALRWWRWHRATARTEQSVAPSRLFPTPSAAVVASRPAQSASVEVPLVIGDERGLRSPTSAGSLAWGKPATEILSDDDRTVLAHHGQVRR